jgi:succinate dehydrogenase / fumarate reductase iron-sulfur subunit
VNVTLRVWRQERPEEPGWFEPYEVRDVHPDASLLEVMDVLNDDLIARGERAIAFDHDCREGICGACSMTINGRPHGPGDRTTTCQIYMRQFPDGATITLEPFRATTFPVIRDLIVDRSALDRIQQAGGYTGVDTGPKPEPNSNAVSAENAEEAIDAAICIGCGACVAACPNASASLFVAAKISHLGLLPQGQPERWTRARNMVATMDAAGFGSCTNHGECEAACPKEISMDFISRMNRDLMRASLEPERTSTGGGDG